MPSRKVKDELSQCVRDVLDAVETPVIVLDAQALIRHFNQAAKALMGCTGAVFIGRTPSASFMVCDEESIRTSVERALAQRGVPPIEVLCHTCGGEDRLVRWGFRAMSMPGGTGRYVVATGVDLTKSRGAQAALESEILRISDTEQRRIGEELHDGICQNLAAAVMACDMRERVCSANGCRGAQETARVGQIIKETIAQTRALARGLQPVKQVPGGLRIALADLAENIQQMFKVHCRVRFAPDVATGDPDVRTHLYRITQEAISNAIRHGRARHIIIRLSKTREVLRLTISDDGVGIPAEVPPGRGVGLAIMAHRAASIGGTLSARRRRIGGTMVRCELPWPREQCRQDGRWFTECEVYDESSRCNERANVAEEAGAG